MNPTEQTAKTQSPRTGIFASLRAFLRPRGTGAPTCALQGKGAPRPGGRHTLGALASLAATLTALALTATPALAAAPEAPAEVTVQSPVKATEATFHGFLNPKAPGALGTYEFLYKKSPTECTGGSKAPASPAISVGAEHEEVSETVKGLLAGTTYTVCLLARTGTKVGENEALSTPPVTFTTATPAEKPETKPATAVTSGAAILHGVLNPKAEAETGWYFAYSTGAKCTSLGVSSGGETAHEAPAKAKALAVETEAAGLEPNRAYKFCLLAENTAEESTPGNEASFTTLPAPPAIPSEAASFVKSTTATLEAQINPENEPTTDDFEYARTEAALLAGTGTKEAGAPLSGFPEQPATVALSALNPGETYFYRVVAENAQSKTEVKPVDGAPQSFTTIPTPATDAPTALTATTATFNGHLTPLNATVPTQYHFVYKLGGECPAEGEPGAQQTGAQEAGTGAATEAKAEASVTGLQPNHEYTLCLVASNASGSQVGPAVHFTTAAVPPRIDGESISAVTPTEATLEAQVNPNNQEVAYSFEYATNEALTGATTVAGAAPLTGFPDQLASVALTGLEVGKTYFYRVVVENKTNPEAVIDGPVREFTPQGPPLAVAREPSEVTRTTAALSGTVNPAGAQTTFHFVYVEASKYEGDCGECEEIPVDAYANGSSTPEAGPVGSDYTAHPVGPATLGELTPGETYDYALVATSAQGVTVSPNMSFTAGAATPPLGTTGPAEGVTQTSATLTGSVDTRGLPSILQFEFGTTPGAGYLSPANVTSQSGTVDGISLTYSALLAPATTYYYRVVASNHDGVAYGAERSFTTGAFPAALVPPAFTLLPVPSTPVQSQPPGSGKPSIKPLTKAQKLAKALKACAKKPRHKRAACRRQAKRKYG